MRLLLPLLIGFLLSSCLNSYSNIDGSAWSSFELQAAGRTARLEAPGGYSQNNNMYLSDSIIGLLELHYDRLSGPTIYGSSYGETRVFLYEIRTDFSGIDDYVQRNAEITCDGFTDMEDLAACTVEKKKHTRYVGQVRDSWHLFEYLSEEKQMLVHDYVAYLGAGTFLNLKGVVSNRAFERESVRSARMSLIEDVFNTLALSDIASQDRTELTRPVTQVRASASGRKPTVAWSEVE